MKYLFLCVALIPSFCFADIPQHLQDVSVTIKTERGEGSGVLITREVEIKGKKEKVNFVWTAAHVIANLRSTRTAIINGEVKQIVEFKDAQIVKELVENGRRVGELKMDAKVIKYSDADLGEDLALLMVRKLSFVDKNTEFVDSDEPLSIGTRLYHVGSLLGQTGSNSMTTGIVSQIGRVLQLGNGDGTVFDQSTVTAFPGCLTQDTLVETQDGFKKIIDLKDGDEVLTYDDRIPLGNGMWTNEIKENDYVLSFQTKIGQIEHKSGGNRSVTKGRVNKVWATGIKPVFKVSTRNRTVRATANHPFVKLVSQKGINGKVYNIPQWTSVDQLKEGDVVAVMKQHTQFKKSQNFNFTHNFGKSENHLPAMRLLGFYCGDGYSRIRKSEGGEVALYTFDEEDSQTYTKIVNQLMPRLNVNRCNTPSGEYLTISSVELAKFFKNCGVTGYATTKRIPEWVFTCPSEFQKEFLEGLVDADGHRNGTVWQIELANESLVNDCWALANNLGMGASNVSTRTRTANIKGRDITSTSWTVEIYPNPVRESAQISGTDELMPEGIKWERISSITPDGKEMTYDMEVGTYHNFFANGFLVHNSSGGGVFLTEDSKENSGKYMGMLVRGGGETFNLLVPVRRMREWATKEKVLWALKTDEPMPKYEDVLKISIEASTLANAKHTGDTKFKPLFQDVQINENADTDD